MITFKLKFLLAFSLIKGKEKPKKIHETKEKGGAKRKTLTEEEDPPYLIRLEKSNSVAHIEYELIPGKCKYQFDVLCWSNAAKIYAPDGVRIFKIITKNGLIFVPVCIQHQLKEISNEELIALQLSTIEFNVFTDKNKLGNAAKANKTEIIYIKETDCGRTDFVEAYAERNKTSVSILSSIFQATKNEANSQIIFEENFAEKLYEIIEFVTNPNAPEDQLQFKDYVKPYNPNEEESKKANLKKGAADKTSAKEKAKIEKASNKLTLQMQGEIFFTDPNLAIFKVENHRCEVSKFFVLLQVVDLLTRSQKIHLNPIVIKTMHISHLPVEVFENTGFTDLYCKYSIPSIAECKTIEKPISRFVHFNESHIYFTHTFSKIKLLEFLESKRLVLEIYGVKRYPSRTTDPKLFGEKKTDTTISKIYTKHHKTCLKHEESLKTTDELLAFCSYDLSSLLRNVWDFREKGQVHNILRSTFMKDLNIPRTEPSKADPNCDFWTTHNISTNSINLAHIQDSFNKNSTLLKEWLLIQRNTTLSLEAYLLSPQAPALVLHQIPNTYKRLFLIAFKVPVAAECFRKILKHNQRIICKKLNVDNLLTGWILDNGNNIAIYVEGLAVGYILNIWQDLDSCPPEKAKIFFNTDQAYEKRIYSVCNQWSGFFIVTLRVPLEYILKDQRVYVKGNVPLLCSKALTKLDLLFQTRTLKMMLQYDLFPTIEELASLDLEYGVPYAWKEPQPSEVISIASSKIINIEDFET